MQKSRKKKLLEGGDIDAMDDSSQTSDSRVNVMDPKTGEVSDMIYVECLRYWKFWHDQLHFSGL